MIGVITIEAAADVVRGGGVVVVPTDTVYGLGALVTNPTAVANIFVAKRRPRDVALPVMVASEAQLRELGVEISLEARALMDAFWPGALTIVMPVSPALAALTGATDSVGFRLPAQPALRALLEATGPLAVTSANRHGEPPCTTAEEARVLFDDGVAGVVDGGTCDGTVSTVVRVGGSWEILRAGAVDASEISAVLGPPKN